jgi:lipoprotein-anchoring transpeptidase ErfK/SrfK
MWTVLPAASSGYAGGDGQARDRVRHGIRLAQDADIDIYYDGLGRRVLVDSWTGEVIAVEPLHRKVDKQWRREQRRQRLRERTYLDPDAPDGFTDMPDDRIDTLREPPDDGYDEDGFPRERSPQDRYVPPIDAEREPDGPWVVRRGPIEREPLTDLPADPGLGGFEDAPEAITPPVSSESRQNVVELQVLLDRLGASPGVIDGRFGSNVDKALAAYRELTGTRLNTTDTQAIAEALTDTGGPALIDYTITGEDAAGPFVASVPADYGEKAKLERLSYTSVAEMLAERFHMDEDYLRRLNPEANFGRPGTVIRVANIGSPATGKASQIVADKASKQVRAYDGAGKLLVAYPATIGSSDTPSPSGTHAVSRVAFDPNYTYNPKLNFQQGNNDRVLTIPPGPNGPVGSIWIALDKPTYGIHGTPDPSKIGKTESHGCVRLTNWDAAELAKMVSEGVTVEFID